MQRKLQNILQGWGRSGRTEGTSTVSCRPSLIHEKKAAENPICLDTNCFSHIKGVCVVKRECGPSAYIANHAQLTLTMMYCQPACIANVYSQLHVYHQP